LLNVVTVFLFAARHADSHCGMFLCGGHWFGNCCRFNNHFKESKL